MFIEVDTLTETIQHLIAQHTAILERALHVQDQLQDALQQERESNVMDKKIARLLNLQLAITERQLSEARKNSQEAPKPEKRKFESEE